MLKYIPICIYLLRLISESTDFLVLLENQLSLSGCCLILFLKTFDLRLKRKTISLMYFSNFATLHEFNIHVYQCLFRINLTYTSTSTLTCCSWSLILSPRCRLIICG